MTTREQHEEMMRQALAAADAAAAHGDVPVGAVVVVDGKVVGTGHNQRETDQDPTAHAEILAIRAAATVLGSWRLTEATLYVSQEPCPMCAGAIVNARLPRLVFGCLNPKAGAVRTLFALCEDPRLNHRVEVTGGVLAEECGARLRSFFETLREG
jgi:tRNA(adenine34) deaminase